MNLIKSLYKIVLNDLKLKKMSNKGNLSVKLKKHLILNRNLQGIEKDIAIDSLIFQIKMLSKPEQNSCPLP